MEDFIIDTLYYRVKKATRNNRKGTYGKIYLPKEFIGKEVSYLSLEELETLRQEWEKLKVIKKFTEHILNSRNHSKMFNMISKTWNPVTGCTHYCIYCWARKLALTRLRNSKKYQNGFLPKIHLEEFKMKFKDGDIVFVTDMGDLFSDGVPDDWIVRVVEFIKKFPNTYFLFLTKNPRRYHNFVDLFPPNAILGATIETNRDGLYIHHRPRISLAPLPSIRYKAMKELEWPMKFISIEPILDFDLDVFTKWIIDINPFMVYVGYDNYKWKLPEPPLSKTLELIKRLTEHTLVVKKTLRPAWNESLIKYSS